MNFSAITDTARQAVSIGIDLLDSHAGLSAGIRRQQENPGRFAFRVGSGEDHAFR